MGAATRTVTRPMTSSTHDLLLGAGLRSRSISMEGLRYLAQMVLRIKVTGGGDGSGAVTVAIVESTEGLNTYLIADDDGVFEPKGQLQVHAGDDSTYIEFTYTAQETIADGELRFTAPTDWDPMCRSIAHGRPVIRLLVLKVVRLVLERWTARRWLSRSLTSPVRNH